jgi:hypothetical protein
MVEFLFVAGRNWGNMRGFAARDPSVFKSGETFEGEWLYAVEAWKGGERTRESLVANEGSSGDEAKNSASRAKDGSREEPACTPRST